MRWAKSHAVVAIFCFFIFIASQGGVTAFIPSWKDMMPDGKELEGVGIEPDIAVNASPADFQQSDPVLEAALTHLRQAKQ